MGEDCWEGVVTGGICVKWVLEGVRERETEGWVCVFVEWIKVRCLGVVVEGRS